MTAKIKTGGSWSNIASIKIKVGSAWKNISQGYIKNSSGIWRLWFGNSGPQIDFPLEISSNSSSYPATLTGKNYHWDSGDSFTSKFEKGVTADGPWSDATSFEFIANPADGSFNTKTFLLLEDDFILNQSSTFFRFVVKAVNSISNETTTEVSDPIEISVPDAVMSHSGGQTVVTSTSISIPFTYNFALKYYIVEAYGPLGLVSSTRVDTPSSPVVVQNLSPSTTYDIVIFPYNFVNMVGTALLGIGITTLAPDPSPPTIISSSSTINSITLNFNLGANSTSTRVYINGIFDGSTTGTNYTLYGLSPGTSYTLSLYGYNGTVQSSTSSGGTYSTQYGPALTPTFGTNISTTGGFFGSVTNYDANYTWAISTSAGSVSWSLPSGNSRSFTVSGLSSGQSATVTVTTSRSGYNGGSAQTTGSASTIVYTVTWNANGGSVFPPSNTVNAGSSVIAPTPTRSGYTFNYWRSPISGDLLALVYAGGSYTPTENITFYAIWTLNVSVPSGGSVSLSGGSTSGSVISASTSGWSDSPTSYDVFITTAFSPNVPTSSSSRVASSGGGSSASYTITTSDAIPPVNIFRAFATASNAAGTSGIVQSGNIITTTSSAIAPSTPTGLTNTYSSGPTWTGTWSASSGTAPITYYWTLRQSLTNGGAITNTASGSTTGTSFTQSMNSTYGFWAYFTVYASNSAGSSGTATSGWA